MKLFRLYLLTLLGLLLFFLLFTFSQSVPQFDDLSTAEKKEIFTLAHSITREHDGDVEKLSALMAYLRGNLAYEGLEGYDGGIGYDHTPSGILAQGWGLCYDFSHLFEIMAQSLGYKTRHISLVSATYSPSSHAASEVKVAGKWGYFDPSFARYYVDDDDQILPIRTLIKQSNHRVVHVVEDYGAADPSTFGLFAYGIFNFHGKQFAPKISYPDTIFSQLHYNVLNTRFPFNYRNLHYLLIAGGLGLLALTFLLWKREH